MNKEELIKRIAKALLNHMWIGAELGIGNSSLRDLSLEQYYELNQKEWETKAQAMIDFVKENDPELLSRLSELDILKEEITFWKKEHAELLDSVHEPLKELDLLRQREKELVEA